MLYEKYIWQTVYFCKIKVSKLQGKQKHPKNTIQYFEKH